MRRCLASVFFVVVCSPNPLLSFDKKRGAKKKAAMMKAKRLVDLLVVVGPSGSGKSSLISQLQKEFPNAFGYSVSHTTRGPRAGEADGMSYHFVTEPAFRDLVGKGQFIEHAVVHDTMYGTSERSVENVLSQNRVCLMDLDLVGAQNLRKHPTLRSLIVFVSPPSFEELESRLRGRGTETEERIAKRLRNGVKELEWFEQNKDFFDASFVNDNLDECYDKFREKVMTSAFAVPTHHR